MPKITKTVKKKVTVHKCDICGKIVWTRYYCCICHKEICHRCLHTSYNSSDQVDMYCKPCWEIGKSYMAKIEKIEEKADDQIENLTNEWHSKCRKDD